MIKKDRSQEEHFVDSPEPSCVLQCDESTKRAGNKADVVLGMVQEKLSDPVNHPCDGQKFEVFRGRVEIKYREGNLGQGLATFAQVVGLARLCRRGKSMEKEK